MLIPWFGVPRALGIVRFGLVLMITETIESAGSR